MEEVNISLTLNKQHKVLNIVPVIGISNGKSLKDYLLGAISLKLNEGRIRAKKLLAL